jgi:hypothetical protein
MRKRKRTPQFVLFYEWFSLIYGSDIGVKKWYEITPYPWFHPKEKRS